MKFFQQVVNSIYALGADHFYRSFVKDTQRAGEVNREILKEILTLNSGTIYGQTHSFGEIKNSKDYQKRVPLTEYVDYESFVEEIASGKENVLTSEPVQYFGLSSGTTGKQKKIPTTARTRKIMNMSMMFTQHGLLRRALPAARRGGKGLLLMNMLQSGTTPGGVPTGAGTSSGVQSMKKFLPYFWTSPLEVLAISDQRTANYLHLLFALQEQNLAYIMAPFPSGIVQLFGVLEEKWPELVQDLRLGQITPQILLDPEIRSYLKSQIKPNPLRAERLKKEFALGMKGIARRIWPKMGYLSCVAGGSFSIYMEKLKDYTGNLPVYSAVYGATEALIGLAANVNDATYVVTPRSAYYEFIPIQEAERSTPSALELSELKIGETYEVVVTNFSGFYRYRLGDVIKVVGYFHESPVLEFQYRKGQLLNLSGEKTSEQAVQQALSQTALSLGVTLEDYTVVLDLKAAVGHYHFYVEVDSAPIDCFETTLENCLQEMNPRYRVGVEGKRIAPLRVDQVQPGTFQKLRQELLRRGASLNQVKIPRLIKDARLIGLLEENRGS